MDFLDLCRKRFSARSFTSEAISDEDKQYIMECVRLAPSAVNMQPWKFVLVASEAAKAELRKSYDREWFATAPLYVLCLADTSHCWVRKYVSETRATIRIISTGRSTCPAALKTPAGASRDLPAGTTYT